MPDKSIILFAILFLYYHLAGMATTNILRLTAGNTLTIHAVSCHCDNCGMKLPLYLQFPIFSYLFTKGRCSGCGVRIPPVSLVLEITLFFGMSAISALFRFSALGIALSFLFYEIVRVITIAVVGRREKNFWGQYVVAVLTMLFFMGATELFALLYAYV